jgi:hypothetical protein
MSKSARVAQKLAMVHVWRFLLPRYAARGEVHRYQTTKNAIRLCIETAREINRKG